MSITKVNNLFMKKLVDAFCEKQIESINRIKTIAGNSKSFNVVEFSTSNLLNYTDFKIKKVLYYFEIAEEKEISKIICKKITERKTLNGSDLKLPQVNMENAESGSKILYVGKSLGWFSTRLKQHCSDESKLTYALHLKLWKKIIGKDVALKLHYISFDDVITNEEKDLLELIETALHNSLKPILGRTGH